MIEKFHDILKNRFSCYDELMVAVDELECSSEFVKATLSLLNEDNSYAEFFMVKAFQIHQHPEIIKLGFQSEHRSTRSTAFELLDGMDCNDRKGMLRSWLLL